MLSSKDDALTAHSLAFSLPSMTRYPGTHINCTSKIIFGKLIKIDKQSSSPLVLYFHREELETLVSPDHQVKNVNLMRIIVIWLEKP